MKKTKKVVLSIACLLALVVLGLYIRGDQIEVTVYTYDYLYELEEMMEQSSLIVYGKVTNQSDVLQIQHAENDTISHFIDYTMEPIEVLRGEQEENTPISIRIEGGKKDNLTVIADSAAELEQDKDYILFLYRPMGGGGYNTEGDYYYVTGGYQGVYEIVADEIIDTLDDSLEQLSVFKNEQQIYYNENIESLEEAVALDSFQDDQIAKEAVTLEGLRQELLLFNLEHPANEYAYYERSLSDLKWNLDTGYISQEEYDRALEQETNYAKIIG